MTDETRRELEAIKSELYRLSYRVRALEEQLTRDSREPNGGATPRVRPEPETVPAGANTQVRPIGINFRTAPEKGTLDTL